MEERAVDGSDESQAAAECWNKALDLLARRSHFRRQIETKLRQRGFSEEQVAEVCDRLEERKFLDDLECARSLASGSFKRKLFGPRRVRAELIRRGASESVADQAVGEVFRDGEEQMLRESVSKWASRNRWDRHRLARHLERRGYSSGVILRVIDEFDHQESGETGVGRRW